MEREEEEEISDAMLFPRSHRLLVVLVFSFLPRRAHHFVLDLFFIGRVPALIGPRWPSALPLLHVCIFFPCTTVFLPPPP